MMSADLALDGILDLFTARVRGSLARDVALPDMVAGLELVGRGGVACCPATTVALQARRSVGIHTLSEREVAVLEHLAQGASNADIAAALGISISTVEHYVGRVMGKTGQPSRAGLAAWWSRRSLFPE
jgi:DNA-binding NarL/FixJ family response regulator